MTRVEKCVTAAIVMALGAVVGLVLIIMTSFNAAKKEIAERGLKVILTETWKGKQPDKKPSIKERLSEALNRTHKDKP